MGLQKRKKGLAATEWNDPRLRAVIILSGLPEKGGSLEGGERSQRDRVAGGERVLCTALTGKKDGIGRQERRGPPKANEETAEKFHFTGELLPESGRRGRWTRQTPRVQRKR